APCAGTCHLLHFFFSSRRRHTRFSRDWSSDVCSSDLGMLWVDHLPKPNPQLLRYLEDLVVLFEAVFVKPLGDPAVLYLLVPLIKIGRASCRERVWISVVAVGLEKISRDSMRRAEAHDM